MATPHVRAKELLTAGEIERCLRKYVYPSWAERDFASIKRSDITKLLDKIEDAHGAGQADAVLAIVRKLTNWHASPGTGGMTPAMMSRKPFG